MLKKVFDFGEEIFWVVPMISISLYFQVMIPFAPSQYQFPIQEYFQYYIYEYLIELNIVDITLFNNHHILL